MYRPFDKQFLFFAPPLIEMLNQTRAIFGLAGTRKTDRIAVTDPTSQKPFMTMAGDIPFDMHLVGPAAGASGLPRYRYDAEGERVDNITDWELQQFLKAFGKKPNNRPLTKDAIFRYVYAVLHDPIYRETYARNLKRDLPRIPLHSDFWLWSDWGEELWSLHLDYEKVEPWPLITAITSGKPKDASIAPRTILKADRSKGIIVVDSETTLSGVPSEAWDYTPGGRSGIDWILEQYKERTPKDPILAASHNTYRFAEYKDKVVALLMRITRVSVETVSIVEKMKSLARS